MTWLPLSPHTYSMSANGRTAILHTRKGSMLYRLDLIDGPRTVSIDGIGGKAALVRARGWCK